jgi:hypothetical protein
LQIDTDAEGGALIAQLQANICEQLGLSDCSQVQIDGIGSDGSVTGRRRLTTLPVA